MRRTWFLVGLPILWAIVAAVIAIVVTGSQTSKKFSNPDKSALWAIQPGLGTVMMEYATRLGNAWWAADAGNWDMVKYQVDEMTEIQEVGETTRPGRAEALKKFEHEDLDPLLAAAAKQDKTAFADAYDKAITGCNKCHGEQKDSKGNTFRFIKIVRPTGQSPFSNVAWSAQ